MNGNLAFGEDGALVESADFPHEEICRREEARATGADPDFIEFTDPTEELKNLTPEELAIGLDVMDRMLKWVWQSGMKNADGVKIRAIILCWVCLKELRSLTMTDMAVGYGLAKQSLGRWVDEDPNAFKKKFPTVRTTHMR